MPGQYRGGWWTPAHAAAKRSRVPPTRRYTRSHETHGAPCLDGYLKALVAGAGAWTEGASTKDYPGYDKLVEAIKKDNFESTLARGAAWVGTPEFIIERIKDFQSEIGVFDVGSLQATFGKLPHDLAKKSVRLFSETVIPHFKD